MINASIKNLKLFEVIDETSTDTFYGGWQEWYSAWWKRLSGCGPTTVSNIMSYINRSCDRADLACAPFTKSDFQRLMEDVWEYVTPSVRGIPTTAALKKGAAGYIAAKNLNLTMEELDIPKSRLLRPDFIKLLEFIRQSLENDVPLAFLSLDKGQEELLDSWHWVTLVALEYAEDGTAAFADVADEGKLLHVDLKKWFDTTGLGGGFVRFVRQ
ncbi:hypothetical protein SAMN02745823_02900 [Sporobacter termitidis DSM 10068]|uniref:Peptidase_C39 like family protein n=1 Tax=Sporobacter termitidis DSM 10068 TaxID=1123282 RepID=A0A1M5YWI1_9FIRM|nr:hypothetical protein [Sporobacter termitidis]SHI16190.1 hypothetical protein SAMN02745823_02900 [Sporobacter termitidis DSM 10068]